MVRWFLVRGLRLAPHLLKDWDTGKIAVIILKLEQHGFTIQYCVQSLIWVYTVCPDLSVRKLSTIMVLDCLWQLKLSEVKR